MTTTTTPTKVVFPDTLPNKKVFTLLMWRRDIENMHLLEQHFKEVDDQEGRNRRSQATILRDLVDAEVLRMKLRV